MAKPPVAKPVVAPISPQPAAARAVPGQAAPVQAAAKQAAVKPAPLASAAAPTIRAQPPKTQPLRAAPIPAAPEAAIPVVPVAERPGGRRMLPPRKAAADPSARTPANSPAQPSSTGMPSPEFASNAAADETTGEPMDELFAPQESYDEPTGETDFLSELAGITGTPSAASAASPSASGAAASGSSRIGSSLSASIKTGAAKSRKPGARNQNQKWIWIGAGIATAVAVLVLGTVMLLNNGGNGPATAEANLGLPAHLVFDWPESDRLGAKLDIDGKPQQVPNDGAVEFELPQGKHRISIRRIGKANVEQTVVLKQDERHLFKPEWKDVETLVDAKAGAPSADNDMLVTDALPELKHWLTDIDDAKQKAAVEKKDLLLVFFGPDNRQWCLRLAADLLVKREFQKFVDPKFVLVLLEAPPAASMVDGKGTARAATIAREAAYYTVTSCPTMVLADAQGTAYAREEYKQVPLIDHLKTIADGLAIRKERDKLFAPTETGPDASRLAAAQEALAWLEKNELTALYISKLHSWLDLAAKVDPNNEKGLYESFFLADMRLRLQSAGKEDPERIRAASRPLEDWQKAGRKFKDGDVAARTYLSVAGMLFNAGDPEAATAFIEGAYNCNPGDPRLKAYLGQLHAMMTSPVSFGSGFVFAAGGYILTNNHVIAGDGKIFVRVPGNKKEIPAQVVSASPQLDVAVIKMVGDIPAIKPLPLATTTLPRGTEVVAFGYPLGQEDMKLTQGPVSAPPSEKEHYYVLDMRVNPGNSGGPLVDMKGEVVGIVSAKTVARDEKEDSYGLAIPGQTVAGFVKKVTPSVPDFHPLGADDSAKLTEQDKLTKVDAIVSQAVVQIVKRRG
jgi:S1-C subfamily serine protease